MMRSFNHFSGLAVAWVLAVGTASPAAGDPPAARVATLIQKLGSENYAERKEAGAELAELGASGRSQLAEAAGADDPEVALRARDLLRRLQLSALWESTPVEIDSRDEPASKVLQRLEAQTGNKLLVGEGFGSFEDKPVSLSVRDGSWWEAVDALCRQSGNYVRPHYNPRRPGLVLVGSGPGKNPVAYSGPVRAQVTSARRVFIEQFDYEVLASKINHTFQLDLQLMWEDRFQLLAYRSQPELVAAVTDLGVHLPATEPGSGGWNVAGPGVRQLTTSLRLHPPPAAAQALTELRLRWALVAVGDMATLEIEDLTPGRRYHRDDLEAVLESFEEQPGSRWTATVLVSRDLAVPDPQEMLLYENTLELLDQQGRPLETLNQANVLADRGARLKVSFHWPQADSKPDRLRLTYPRLRSQRSVEIVLKEVPLPTARPE